MSTVYVNGTTKGSSYHARVKQLASERGHFFNVEVIVFDSGTENVYESYERVVPEYYRGFHLTPIKALKKVLRDSERFV